MDIAQTAPQTVILAEDEASLYLQATTTAVWAPCGQTPVVRCDPGRAKVNFFGTLNLQTGEETVSQADIMNNTTTAEHLTALLSRYPDQPLLLLWDRAPWHNGPSVRAVLQANPRLEILCFPPATPELNPQEHVWKATRQAVSHNHDQRHLPRLAERFANHLTGNNFQYSLLEKYNHSTLCAMFN
jgi:DDE superfamily endonuclease